MNTCLAVNMLQDKSWTNHGANKKSLDPEPKQDMKYDEDLESSKEEYQIKCFPKNGPKLLKAILYQDGPTLDQDGQTLDQKYINIFLFINYTLIHKLRNFSKKIFKYIS